MSRAAGAAGGRGDRRALAVINARLIAECIDVGRSNEGDASGGRPGQGKGGRDGRRGKAGESDAVSRGAAGGAAAAPPVELHEATSLTFSFRSIGKIDNLIGVRKLTKLQLDNNHIAKIENLDELTCLTWLDLSFNKISTLEGLDRLVNLENVSLYANDIATATSGMDTLSKLMCCSLGRNKIEDLDGTARYFHRFDSLRMLTLLGNKICAMPSYRQKVLAYNQRLKFLDHRLVLPSEIEAETNLAKEYITHVEDEDRRRAEGLRLEKEARDEEAKYDAANCPHEQKLYDDLSSLEVDARPLRAMLAVDFIREQTKEVVEDHQTRFVQKGKEMAEKMKDLYGRKQSMVADFERTYAQAKSECDEASKALIKTFEKKMKALIPVDLRARPSEDNFDEQKLADLRQELNDLRSDLLELEATQLDSFESLLKGYDEILATLKQEAIETIFEVHFKALADLVKDHFVVLKSRLDHLHDERLKALQEQNEQGAGGGGGGGGSSSLLASLGATSNATDNSRDKAAVALFDNKDEYTKALHDTEALQVKRLEDREEVHRKEEDARYKKRMQQSVDREHERNRSRVCEILAYVERQEQRVTQWERAMDA